MKIAQFLVTAVAVEGHGVREAPREYGASKSWVSELCARYRAEGEAGLPRTSVQHRR